ncbi:MAG: hypothetical protein ABEJ36_05810 [Candidatus Nanosalina sp.]
MNLDRSDLAEQLSVRKENFKGAVSFSFETRGRALATFAFSVVLTGLFVLSSFPGYSIQMIGADINYLNNALNALTLNYYHSSGAIGLASVMAYSMIISISFVNLISSIQLFDLRQFFKGAGSASPGVLIGGCAGCGAGLLGFFGFGGALALLPFGGNGLRLLGIGLLIFFLSESGNPEKCRIEDNQ